jgi:hypothetical protein
MLLAASQKKYPCQSAGVFGFYKASRNSRSANLLQSITARQNFLRELKVLMRLVLRSHPSP